MRNLICAFALAVAASTLCAQTAVSQPSKSWPLEKDMVIRFGRLSVNDNQTIACFRGDVFTHPEGTTLPSEPARGWVTLDLRTGKMTELKGLFAGAKAKGRQIQTALLSPSGKQLAVVLARQDGSPEVLYECHLFDLAGGKGAKLSAGVGRMRIFWTGQTLLVSRNKADGVDAVERWTAEGKKIDSPAFYAHVLAASDDGKTLLAYCGKNPSKPLKFTDDDVALRILKDGKDVKDLGDAQKLGAERGVFSPSGKFVAFPVRDEAKRRQGISVVEIGGESSFLETKALPLGIDDSGFLCYMSAPQGGGWDKNAEPSAVKRWDGKKESTVVEDALDACFAGGRLYYIQAGDRPALKAMDLRP